MLDVCHVRILKIVGSGTEWDNTLDEELGFVTYVEPKPPKQRKNKMPETQVVQSKNILKSKTFWFNIATAGLGLFTNAYMSVPGGNMTVTAAIAAGNIFLRSITSAPVTILPEEDKVARY